MVFRRHLAAVKEEEPVEITTNLSTLQTEMQTPVVVVVVVLTVTPAGMVEALAVQVALVMCSLLGLSK